MTRPIRKLGIAKIAAVLAAAAPLSAGPAAPPRDAGTVEARVLTFDDAGVVDSVNAPLVAGSRFTAMDLLKRVFTDIDPKGSYRTVAPVKSAPDASGPDWESGFTQPEGDVSMAVDVVRAAVVRQGRHTIGFVLGDGVLVSDWLLPAPAVGGSLLIQIDPGGQPVIEKAFPIAEGKAAVLVSNSHFNAGEGFEIYKLYAQGFSGLSEVYDGPNLYSFAASNATCDGYFTRQSLSRVRPLASRHGGHADIAMEVTETTSCNNNEDAPLKVRRFPFTLTWDAKARRYRGGSPALDRLNKRRWD